MSSSLLPAEPASRAGVAEPAPARPAAPPSYRDLLIFLAPLLFTGLMMTADQPLVNAALTRLPGAQEALAALVVAFGLALVYEAPHVTMIEVATALATTRQALGLLRRFYAVFAGALAVLAAALLASPLYDALVRDLMGIPPDVAAAARPTLAAFVLWPIPIGWRRLHQGALIRHGHSRAVGAGATVRIVALLGTLAALLAVFNGTLGGSTIGALAMLGSVTAEAVYTDLAARRLLRGLPAADPAAPARAPLTLGGLWEVFWPLAGTTILNTLNRPLLSAGIAAAGAGAGGAHGSEAALAAWGVGWGVISLINGATLVLSQVAIAWDADPRPGIRGRGARIIVGAGLGLTALVALVAWTPLADWLLGAIYAVTPALAAAATPVIRLLVPVPILAAVGGLLRGRLIARGRARAVRTAQIVDLGVLLLVLGVGTHWPDPATAPGGALLGAVASLAVLLSDAAVLAWSLRRGGRGTRYEV